MKAFQNIAIKEVPRSFLKKKSLFPKALGCIYPNLVRTQVEIISDTNY